MSSGSHTHGEHTHDLFYSLFGYDYSLCVLYRFLGNDSFELFFMPAATFPGALLAAESLAVFKIPANVSATFRLTKVGTGIGEHDHGKFLVDLQLHPFIGEDFAAYLKTAREDGQKIQVIGNDPNADELRTKWGKENSTKKDPPSSICNSTEPECPGQFSPCKFGYVVKNDEVHGCGCYRPERDRLGE